MKRHSWQLPLLLFVGAVLTLPTSASATSACECQPFTSQVAPGPGGCTLRRECKAGWFGAGSPDNVCNVAEVHETDDDGIITITHLTGYWTPWTEICVKDDTSAAEIELLIEGLNR